MKKSIILLCILLLNVCFIFAGETSHIDVMFMHDVHSFLDETARAKTLIDEQKNINPDTLVLDAGDFSMGTLYQTVFDKKASELRILGKIGVDATTIGNHEFDFGGKALSDMFIAAKNSGDRLPAFVLCNVDWSNPNEYTRIVKKGLDDYGHSDYVMINKGGLKAAVIGVFGRDALFCAPTCELTILDQIESVKKTVKTIKEKEDADIIICLSHSGTSEKSSDSEDEILAKAVPDLDLIISGHTHTVLNEPIVHGSTVIASCGAYSAYLGSLGLDKDKNGRWKISDYKLIPLKESIAAEDFEIKAMLSDFARDVDSEYLSKFGYTSNQVIASSARDIDEDTEIAYLLGDCMYDSIRKSGVDVDFVVIPVGLKRGTFKRGDITVGKTFETYSLGIGPDGITGYPLVKAYVTGKEIKSICEMDCSLSPFGSVFNLFLSKVIYVYNPHRIILDKVTDVYIEKIDGTLEKVSDDKKYCIVSDTYSASLMGSVLKMSKGLIELAPRDEDGNVIKDFTTEIIYTPEGRELKGWIAIANGLESMKIVPDYSNRINEIKIAEPSWNPFKILANPSKFAVIVRSLVIGLACIIVLVIFIVKKHVKH